MCGNILEIFCKPDEDDLGLDEEYLKAKENTEEAQLSLRKCKYCAAQPILLSNTQGHSIQCWECTLEHTMFYDTPEEAQDIWNTL